MLRCPAAPVLVVLLVGVQGAMAVGIVLDAPGDALATLGLLGAVALAWRFVR